MSRLRAKRQADIEPQALSGEIASGKAARILDVRSATEYARGHVPGAVHVPFWSLRRLRSIPGRPEDPIVVYCALGPRAWFAGSILRRCGFRHVRYLVGHFSAWHAAGMPEERP